MARRIRSDTPVQVVDEGDLHKYFTEIPNLIVRGYYPLSINAKWLYVYLKGVAGDRGVCYQSTSTIAEGSGLSRGAVSQAKKELLGMRLIKVTLGARKNRDADTIAIADIWLKNMQEFSAHKSPPELPCSSGELPCSSGELPCSSGELPQPIETTTELDSSVHSENTGVHDMNSGVHQDGTKKIPLRSNSQEREKTREKSAREKQRSASEKPTRKKKPAATPYPESFTITASMAEWFAQQPFSIDRIVSTEAWADSMRANPDKYRYADWAAAWRTGMRNAQKWQPAKGKDTGLIPDLDGVLTAQGQRNLAIGRAWAARDQPQSPEEKEVTYGPRG